MEWGIAEVPKVWATVNEDLRPSIVEELEKAFLTASAPVPVGASVEIWKLFLTSRNPKAEGNPPIKLRYAFQCYYRCVGDVLSPGIRVLSGLVRLFSSHCTSLPKLERHREE